MVRQPLAVALGAPLWVLLPLRRPAGPLGPALRLRDLRHTDERVSWGTWQVHFSRWLAPVAAAMEAPEPPSWLSGCSFSRPYSTCSTPPWEESARGSSNWCRRQVAHHQPLRPAAVDHAGSSRLETVTGTRTVKS